MPVEVFVDESAKNGYLIAATAVELRHLKASRTSVRRCLLSGERRIHFAKETTRRRREVLSKIVSLDLAVGVFFSTSSGENSRSKLIREVVAHHGDNLHRLVFESGRHRDLNDQRLLISMRLAGEFPAHASFEHLLPYEEPLLWVSDAIAWSWRAKGDWRRRVVPIVAPVVRIDP